MSRPLRLEFKNALYHLTSRGDRRENIYEDDVDRKSFLNIFSSVIEQFNWICFSYCLMDNHYHLLIQTPDSNLSKGMRQLNGVFTQTYNRRHQKTGHLFQGRYKSILVDEDAYLLELSRYIVLNPVKAKMVKQVEDWKWSSYQAMIGDCITPEWLSKEFLLSLFSKQRKTAVRKYEEFVAEGIKNGSIWGQLTNQVYLGDTDFVDKVQQNLTEKDRNINIPKIQKRPVPQSLVDYQKKYPDRNKMIIAAYSSGGYSCQEIGGYLGLHFTTIGRIIRESKS